MNPEVQVNVNRCEPCCDPTATWQVVAEYDDSGVNPFTWGPCDLGTARAVLISLASRTNVRKATIEAIA
jgi:hypothetical protein